MRCRGPGGFGKKSPCDRCVSKGRYRVKREKERKRKNTCDGVQTGEESSWGARGGASQFFGEGGTTRALA